MVTRRGLLAGILAASFAPAVVGSGILMPIKTIKNDPFEFRNFERWSRERIARDLGLSEDVLYGGSYSSSEEAMTAWYSQVYQRPKFYQASFEAISTNWSF